MRFSLRILPFLLLSPLFAWAQVMEEESNDNITEAQTIALNESVMGQMGSAYEWDFFKVVIPEYGRLQMNVVNADTEPSSIAICAPYDFGNPLGLNIASPNPAGPQVEIAKCCLAPGTYYFRIHSPVLNGDPIDYTMETIFTPYDGINDEETPLDNEEDETANDLTLGEEYAYGGVMGFDDYTVGFSRDEIDWYKVELPLRSHIFVDSVGVSAEYDAMCSGWDLSVPDYDVFLMNSEGEASGVVETDLQSTCIAAGSVFINWEDPGFSGIENYCYGYSVMGHVETVPNGDDADNDKDDSTQEGAIEIIPNEDTEYTGYLGYKYHDGITTTDEYDWFKFTTTGPGTVTVHFEWDPEVIGVLLNWYSPDGTGLPFPQSTNQGEGFRSTTISCVNAGQEIYFRVRRWGGTCGDYKFYFSLPPEGETIAPDNNNTLETAQEVELDQWMDVDLGFETYDDTEDNEVDAADYYRIEIPDGNLEITFDEVEGDYPQSYLYILDLAADPDENISQTSPPWYTPDEVIDSFGLRYQTYECLGAGTYVLLLNNTGLFTCDQFKIKFEMEGGGDFDNEPNNVDPIPVEGTSAEGTLGYAFNYSSGGFFNTDNLDKYTYNFESGGDFFVEVEGGEGMNFDLDVRAANGAWLTDYGNVIADDLGYYRWELNCLGAGELTIDLRLEAGSACGPYTMNLAQGTGLPSDNEPNDTSDEAVEITLNEDQNGTLGMLNPEDIEESDFEDWYVVDWPGGDLSFLLTSTDSIMPFVSVYAVFGENSEYLSEQVPEAVQLPGTDDFTAEISFECMGEGAYYVRLSAAEVNNYGCRDYTLSVLEDDEANGPVDEEPFDASTDLDEGQIGENQGNLGQWNWYDNEEGSAIFFPDYEDTWVIPMENAGTVTLEVSADVDFSGMSGGHVTVYESLDGFQVFPVNSWVDGETGNFHAEFGCVGSDNLYVVMSYTPLGGPACVDYTLNVSQSSAITYANDTENNNSFGGAISVVLGNSHEGRLMAETVLNPATFEEDADDRDYYTFEVFEPLADVDFTVDWQGELNASNFSVGLLRSFINDNGIPDSETVSGCVADWSENELTLSLCCLSPGTYFIELLTTTSTCAGYRLQTTAGDSFEDTYESEPDAPQVIGLGEVHHDALGMKYEGEVNNEDYLVWEIDANRGFGISIETPPSSGVGQATLSYRGTTLLSGVDEVVALIPSLGESAVSETFPCMRPGVYMLKVSGGYIGCFQYSLSVDEINLGTDTGEFNNTQESAAALGTTSNTTATFKTYQTEETRDLKDFYTVTIPAGEAISMEVGPLTNHAGDPINMELSVHLNGTVPQLGIGSDTFEWSSYAVNYERQMLLTVFTGADCGSYAINIAPIVTEVGDFDGSGETTTVDVLDILGNWGCMEECDPYDLNGDGIVDVQDLLIIMGAIG